MRVALDYPLVRVQVVVDTSARLIQLLGEGKIDIMVGRLPAQQDNSPFTFERLGEETACAVARPGHPLLGSRDLDLSQLAEASWIVPPVGTALREQFEFMFRESRLTCPNRLVETVSPMVATKLLGQTDFFAVLTNKVQLVTYAIGIMRIAEDVNNPETRGWRLIEMQKSGRDYI